MRDILAGNISRYRKDLRLTQEALAEKLGITFQAVSKWETGQTVPDTILLPALAQALNVSIDKLLGYCRLYSYYCQVFASLHNFFRTVWRKDEVFRSFKKLLAPFRISIYYTDDWGSYQRNLPASSHVISKKNTQTIERKNLTLRTRIQAFMS